MSIRQVKRTSQAKPTLEGAGVHLRRAFGFGDTAETDPFLLLDDFRNDDPDRYRAGFPWHPHRGIETITYVLTGTVAHGDSLGNHGSLGAGDVQWMTAGSGIVHQEMPEGDEEGRMHGFQLWANLPASLKMTEPRYQDVSGGDIPVAVDDDGSKAKVICGSFWGKRGPVEGIAADPRYLDLWIPAGTDKTLKVPVDGNAFAYVFEGEAEFGGASPLHPVATETIETPENQGAVPAANRSLVLFDRGESVRVRTGDQPVRFLLVSGRPLGEPVAWRGPIVMNTQEELHRAFRELDKGTFITHQASKP